MSLANLIVDVVGQIFGEVIGETIGGGLKAIAGKFRKTMRIPRLTLTAGASEADPLMQQVFTDALVAAAHLDDQQLDDHERTIIERGLRSLGAVDAAAAPLVQRAQERLTREDPWHIVESALSEAEPRVRETLAGAVAAVALAGTADRAALSKVFDRVKDAAQLDDKAWDTIMSEARVRVRLVKGKPAGDPAGKPRSGR